MPPQVSNLRGEGPVSSLLAVVVGPVICPRVVRLVLLGVRPVWSGRPVRSWSRSIWRGRRTVRRGSGSIGSRRRRVGSGRRRLSWSVALARSTLDVVLIVAGADVLVEDGSVAAVEGVLLAACVAVVVHLSQRIRTIQ
jgi:hypothetical protein